MLTYSEIRSAMTGSFLLAKRDERGLQFFDVTIDGFWRSFLVVFLIAPFYVLYALQEVEIAHDINIQDSVPAASTGFVAVRVSLLGLEWAIYPVTMIYITRLMGLWPKYITYIAIYNWSSLFISLALAPAAVLYYSGVISAQMTATINLFTILFILYFRWYIARTVLDTAATTATLIVAFDLVLSLLIQGIFSRLTG